MQWLHHLRRRMESERAAEASPPSGPRFSSAPDARAKYLALVRSASIEAIEQAYSEAFALLTLGQRRWVRDELLRHLGRAGANEPRALSPSVLGALAATLERRWPAFLLDHAARPLSPLTHAFGALLSGVVTSAAARSQRERNRERERDADPARAEPDIAGEYGHEISKQNVVGGAGFERDRYDFEV